VRCCHHAFKAPVRATDLRHGAELVDLTHAGRVVADLEDEAIIRRIQADD
jgi:hypothetical protein